MALAALLVTAIGLAAPAASSAAVPPTSLRLACGAGSPGACKGTLTLRTRHKFTEGKGVGRWLVTLGESGFSVAAGKTGTVKLRLAPRLAHMVRINPRAHQVEAIAKVAGGVTTRAALTLRPRARHASRRAR